MHLDLQILDFQMSGSLFLHQLLFQITTKRQKERETLIQHPLLRKVTYFIEEFLMNRTVFYDGIRVALFDGSLNQSQVDGIDAILNFWESPPVAPTGEFKTNWDIRNLGWLAYILATTYHETARTMQPISEYGDNTRFTRLYEGSPELGNTQDGDGAKFCGRGYVQLTGRANYTLMSSVVRDFYPDSPDFTVDPEAVKEPKFAAVILFYGMFMGSFTSRSLKHYIGDPDQGQSIDFYNARQIINGLDCAPDIQGYAEKFNQALDRAGAKTLARAA